MRGKAEADHQSVLRLAVGYMHVTQVSRHSLSLLCPSYENSSKNQKLVYNFGQFKHSAPMERAFTTVSDDIKDLHGRKRDTIQQIATKAGKDVDMKAGMSRRTMTTKKSVYDLEPSASGVVEAVWPSHCDVLVVGGGAVGSSIAYHLKEHARDGLSVVVVEEDPTYKRASTVLSVGGIRQQFSIPENIMLSMYGMNFLRKSPQLLAVEGMDPPDMQFNAAGYLTLASEEGYERLKENYDIQRSVGAKVSFLSSKELCNLYPWMDVSGVAAGVLGRDNEGWFDPWSLLCGLQRKATALGTQYIKGKVTGLSHKTLDDMILEGTSQSNIKCLQSAEVTLTSGEKRSINFAQLVVAAGAWTGNVGRLAGIGEGKGLLGVPIPIETRKRYVYCVHAPDGPGLNSPLLIDPNGTYFRREGLGGHYLCGQSPPEDKEPPVDNLDVDYTFFEEEVWPTIAKRVPAFENLKLRSAWAGYYDYNTFDQNGIIGLHPLFSNMFICGGFSGHGIQQAPGVGRAIMECIIYGEYRTINLECFGFKRILAQTPLLETNIV
ncbi:FAD-dependent oxidoreductase domain-containing protein 1-like isoform X2 [Eriocheir sinensis]|uniref:FAD-dependent oxidoreductase domain-containing protein 1-like isoform X2 n=1 Tax=Eriocheir sinensis TaxID=95602 RepID=UPI0021CA6B36|nr:FAD-dependent oxidoreductase domain-containing protein 1-like isoform X2 [Eriocheir sinensis]